MQFWNEHYVVISGVVMYVFLAGVNNLPEGDFKMYPWLRSTLRSLANHVPSKYQGANQSG